MLSVQASSMSARLLATSYADQARALSRLSSGLRIERAADDAAGLAISERFRARSTGAETALRNVHHAIDLIGTADGGLQSITDLLHRARELAVQAASTGTTDTTSREAAAKEVRQLVAEVDRIASTTAFNGIRLLDASRSSLSMHVGPGAADGLLVDLSDMSASGLGLVGTSGTSSTTTSTTTKIFQTRSERASTFDLRGGANAFVVSVDGATVATFTAAEALYDTDARHDALLQQLAAGLAGTSVSVSRQATGNGRSRFEFAHADGAAREITLSGSGAASMAITTTVTGTTTTTTEATATTPGAGSVADLVAAGSGDGISRIDAALTAVLSFRGGLGATQNGLEHRLGVLGAMSENLTAARSRLVDADLAKEYTDLVRAQVLTQTGLALQAQQAPTSRRVVQLLFGLDGPGPALASGSAAGGAGP